METTVPERRSARSKRSTQWRGRTVGLDHTTDAMLVELSGGRVSVYLRTLIAVEYGRLLERRKSEQE